MPPYRALADMFEVADEFGEHQVLRDVAYRAGWLWVCVNPRCAADNLGMDGACASCSWPAPDPEPREGECRCVCMRLNVDRTCPVCHRENPHFRRS